ncbi:MAG: cytochrome c3 family protein [Deferribacteraceae bacterium]|nr:cytochrome c3 family protein [Deferribacteraceae bacterium]
MKKILMICFLTVIIAPFTSGQEITGKHAKEKKVTCEACHKEKEPTDAASENACIGCHGNMMAGKKVTFKNVVGKEYNLNPHNSHESPIDCTKCHRTHESSVLFCNNGMCHVYDLKAP